MDFLTKAKVGDLIKIIEMKGEPSYTDAIGYVTAIDDAGQIHGTWGGCAVVDEEDTYMVVDRPGSGNFLIWKDFCLLSSQEKIHIIHKYAEKEISELEHRYTWVKFLEEHPSKMDEFLRDYCAEVFEKDFGWKSKWTEASWARKHMFIQTWKVDHSGRHIPMGSSRTDSLLRAVRDNMKEIALIYEDNQRDFIMKTVYNKTVYIYRIRVEDGVIFMPLDYCSEVLSWEGHKENIRIKE